MKKWVDCSCLIDKDFGLLSFRWLGVLLLFISMLTPGQTLDTESQFSFETFEPTGADYTLIVPGGMEAGDPVPLVVALHFGGYTLPHYGRIIAEQIVVPAYEELGAVVVAPDCPQGSWHADSCENTVLGLIDHLRKSFPIDARRIVLTGYSMGGIGTWELASRHQDLFSAAVVMAGNPRVDLAGLKWSLPLYVIHAEHDELMPLADTENVVEAIRAGGGTVELKVLEGVTHFETHRFVASLRETVSWLRGVWRESD